MQLNPLLLPFGKEICQCILTAKLLLNPQISALLLYITNGYQVQEDEITFYLYNKDISNLQLTKENLCELDPSKEIRFVVHPRGGSHTNPFVLEATELYLEIGDVNVIQVDWSRLASQPDYIPRDGTADAGWLQKISFLSITLNGSRLFCCKIDKKTV